MMPPDDMGIIDIILLNTADFLCISLFDAFQSKTGLAPVAAAEAADTHNPVLDWNITQKIKCDKLSGHAAEAKADMKKELSDCLYKIYLDGNMILAKKNRRVNNDG